MTATLIQILPLAIGATFSPSGLVLVVGILSGSENPRRKAFAFVTGSASFLLVLGLAVLLVLKPATGAAPHSHRVSGIIDIVLGLLIVAIVVHGTISKQHEKKGDRRRRVPYGLLGFSFMLVNTSTLVLYVAACKIIVDGGHGLLRNVLLLAVLIAITMFLIAFPVAIAYAAPRGSERILAPVSALMSRYGNRIASVYFLLMAAYLLVRGVTLLD